MVDQISFNQHVPSDGFEWVASSHSMFKQGFKARIREPWNPLGADTPQLMLCWQGDGHGVVKRIQPTEIESGLFLNFAAIEVSPDAIVDFANRFGSIFSGEVPAEPFAEWEYEIRTMRYVSEIWLDSLARRPRVIQKLFVPNAKGVVMPPHQELGVYEPFGRSRRAKPEDTAGERVNWGWTGMGWDSTVAPASWHARRFVKKAINARLKSLGANIVIEGDKASQSRLVVVPHNLLGALWLQFAAAVADARDYRRCGTCGKQFELNPEKARTSRLYCKNACRVKAYRTRKAKVSRSNKSGG